MLHENYSEQKEFALCVFACIVETFLATEDYVSGQVTAQYTSMIVSLIQDVVRPGYYTEEVQREYFNLLTSLIQRSTTIFASEIGTEYLMVFAGSCRSLFGSTGSKSHLICK